MSTAPKLIKLEAGRYRLGEYLIVKERYYVEDRRRWRVWHINYKVTRNTIEHRKGAETELEALPTLKEAVGYVRRQWEFEKNHL